MSSQQPNSSDPNYLSIPTIPAIESPSQWEEGNSNNATRRRGASLGSPSTANTSAVSLAPAENTLSTPFQTRDSRGNLTPSPSGRQPQLRRVPREVWRPSSIRIRRLSSSNAVPGVNPRNNTSTPHISGGLNPDEDTTQSNRRRSSSEPQRPAWLSTGINPTEGPPRVRHGSYIPDIIEEASPNSQGERQDSYFAPIHPGVESKHFDGPPPLQHSQTYTGPQQLPNDEYESNLVDLLDLVGSCSG